MRLGNLRNTFARWTAPAVLAAAIAALAPSPSEAASASMQFTAPGTYQFVVPAGITAIQVDAYGAQGGGEGVGTDGGLGGRASATIAVTPGETLHVYVGGRGGDRSGIVGGTGGFNGGGAGGDGGDIYKAAGGGGGASDVRRGGEGLDHRVVIAGGGGGGIDYSAIGGFRSGGAGGGLVGGDAATDAGGGGAPGAGGTQSAGGAAGASAGTNGTAAVAGSLGIGGAGADATQIGGGGGGGGSWGGGGGGGADLGQGVGRGGGGGSGYGPAGTVFETGVRAGDGEVTLTFAGTTTALTIQAPKSVSKGKRVKVSGVLSATPVDPACTASRTLHVTSGTKSLPDVVTGPDGSYSFVVRVTKTTTIRVRYDGDADCTSAEVSRKIRVRR